MYTDLKNPYKILPKYGYVMVGRSNAFRRHTSERVWFHVFVDHDEQGIRIHQDYSKVFQNMYSQHKTQQKNDYILWEIKKIKELEQSEKNLWKSIQSYWQALTK